MKYCCVYFIINGWLICIKTGMIWRVRSAWQYIIEQIHMLWISIAVSDTIENFQKLNNLWFLCCWLLVEWCVFDGVIMTANANIWSRSKSTFNSIIIRWIEYYFYSLYIHDIFSMLIWVIRHIFYGEKRYKNYMVCSG